MKTILEEYNEYVKLHGKEALLDEFNEYVKHIGTAREVIDCWFAVRHIKRCRIYMLAYLNFLKAHDFDCTHLWEDDTEEGDRAFKDYDQIIRWETYNIPGDDELEQLCAEFDELTARIGTAEELKSGWELVKRNVECVPFCLKFLKEHNFDCTHLYEGGEAGKKAYEDYEQIWKWIEENIPNEDWDD